MVGRYPLWVMPLSHPTFRNLCQMQEDNSSFSLLLDLLSELYQKQPKIGYHLLYYLRARWVQEATWRASISPVHVDSLTLGFLHQHLPYVYFGARD